MKQNGFSLLELVLYVAVVIIVLAGLTTFLLNTMRVQSGLAPGLRLKETATVTMLLMSHNITGANNINVTASTLGSNPSTLILEDGNGDAVQIRSVQDAVDFGGTVTYVDRLQLTKGAEAPAWITDANLNVDTWQIDTVDDSGGILTGLKIDYVISTIDSAVSDRTFTGSTTIPLTPNTLEI
ncbi:hypothetical protein HOI83_03760 [Candidatus Uhrbacteria bacterium]|nr:hypothetical protein [Candidatus Uhrbacteria bacterium]